MDISSILVLIGFNLLILDAHNADIRKSCTEKLTCEECITSNYNCGWCSDDEYNGVSSRCDLLQNLKSCTKVENPKSESHTVKDNKLSPPGADPRNIVQIAPQEFSLKVRIGEPTTIKVKFRQAEDYPVDLYYIMDLSQSMKVHKEKLAQLGDTLAEEMSKITKNFHLGFGSFVDKVALPYVSTVPEKLERPCPDCEAPYGFINRMPLSDRTGEFKNKVNAALMSGNIDAPEGGLDAIMQAIVCEKEIAWRSSSRKLIVLSTDAGYHIAGDGKLGGIVKPNDEKCHLDAKGNYTASTLQDYPSVGQLKWVLDEKNVYVIFAVTESAVKLYETLAKRLVYSGTGQLDKDSRNVVELIKNEYNKISSKVILNDNAGDDFKVSYYSKCLMKTGIKQETNTCQNLKIGDEVEFEIFIEAKQKICSKDKNQWKKQFSISPFGLKESVIVNIDVICECDCQLPGIREEKSEKCHYGNGTFECGICNCDTSRYGHHCECGATDAAAVSDDTKSCMEPNSSTVCSGVGHCVCGVCDCSSTGQRGKPLSGKYCECDDHSCPMHHNKLCSGNGKCTCGECVCDTEWGGLACDCTTKTTKCKAPGSDDICSNNGKCVCGRCSCESTSEGRYIGVYCEECPSCTKQCDMHWPCVVCQENFGGESREICNNFTCTVNVTLEDTVGVVRETERFCVKKDYDDCKINYKYGTMENGQYYIIAQRTKECSMPVNVALIASSVIGGVVAVGICLLLIWKVLTTVHDRREFAKFENERQAAKWDKSENPIYKPSTTTFQNPTYNQ